MAKLDEDVRRPMPQDFAPVTLGPIALRAAAAASGIQERSVLRDPRFEAGAPARFLRHRGIADERDARRARIRVKRPHRTVVDPPVVSLPRFERPGVISVTLSEAKGLAREILPLRFAQGQDDALRRARIARRRPSQSHSGRIDPSVSVLRARNGGEREHGRQGGGIPTPAERPVRIDVFIAGRTFGSLEIVGEPGEVAAVSVCIRVVIPLPPRPRRRGRRRIDRLVRHVR